MNNTTILDPLTTGFRPISTYNGLTEGITFNAAEFIFQGGWLWSWTTNLLLGVVGLLIIWNIYLTWKFTAKTGNSK